MSSSLKYLPYTTFYRFEDYIIVLFSNDYFTLKAPTTVRLLSSTVFYTTALGSMGSGFNSWRDQKNKIVLITLFFIQPDGKSWECSKWGMLWGITLLKPYAKNTHVVDCFAITNRMRFFVSFTRKNNSCVGRWWLRFTNPLSFRYADLSRWNNKVECFMLRPSTTSK